MGDSPISKKSGTPGDQKKPAGRSPAVPPVTSSPSSASKPDMIKEKFLAVAKEKNQLESVIMQQSDLIKTLEKDKSELTLTLKILTESHRKMKEKLLDFDILRNMEVSEFKKKIENLITENKKLLSEKDVIFRNLDRDQKNISVLDTQMSHTLLKEKEELETRLHKTLEDLKQYQAQDASRQELPVDSELPEHMGTGEHDSDRTHKELLLSSRFHEAALDRDEARAELYHARAEIDRLSADKARTEEELQQKIMGYSAEISDLRNDIDELTSAIESKIHYIDEVHANVALLSDELAVRDSELHEKIPALLDKVNSLSLSIEKKQEESSLFAKELLDLNVKISALNDELIRKEELLIEITEDYRKQKEEISSLHEVHGQPLQDLQEENAHLRQEVNNLKIAASETEMMIETSRDEKDLLERKAAESDNRIEELARENAALAAALTEKDTAAADLLQELATFRNIGQQTAAETGSQIATLREQVLSLLEKNELLTTMSSEKLAEADTRMDELARENAALASMVAEKEKTVADLQQNLARSRDLEQLAAKETEYQISALKEQVFILNQQLLEKNELLTVLSSERLQEKKDFAAREADYQQGTSLLEDETNRLKEDILTRENQIEEYRSQMDAVLQDKAQIEGQFMNALEKLQELADEQARLSYLVAEKEHSLAQAQREGDALRTSAEYLKQKISELEKAMSEKEPAFALADTEKEQLLRSAHEYQETFEHLKEEIISLNRTIAEKEQQITRLVAESNTLANKIAEQRTALEQSQNKITDLHLRLTNTHETGQRSEEEKQELHEAVAGLKIEMENLRKAKEGQVAEMKKDLSAYAEALADLRSNLEQSMSENASLHAQLRATQDTSGPIRRKKEETLPARLAYSRDTRTRSGIRPLTYALLALLLVVLTGAAFYAHNSGLLVLPDRTTPQRAEPKKELSYQELFALLNRSVADGLKFQATLLTEPLILKSEEPGDRALFDFQRHLYFKITVSSPKDGFDKQIADDPHSRILLSAGTTDVRPLPGEKVKNIKTFYRKELPVSAIFYCAFPKETIAPDSTVLRLSLKRDTAPSTLVWDLRQLRENNIVP